MNNIDEVKIGLVEFLESDKFKKYQHLQPAVENSTDEDKKFINDEMNACTNELLEYLATDKLKEEELKKIVRNSLERIEDAWLDTEDREFCYELFWKIGEIIGIDIEDNSKSIEDKLKEDLQRLMKKIGINPDDFVPPSSPLK